MTRILGFDTATADVSVAVTEDGEAVAESLLEGPAEGPPNHASALLPEIERHRHGDGWVGARGADRGRRRPGLVHRAADRRRHRTGAGPGAGEAADADLDARRARPRACRAPAAAGSGAAAGDRRPPRRGVRVSDRRRRGDPVGAFRIRAGGPCGSGFASSVSTPLAAGSGALRFRRELEEAGAEVLPATDNAHRVAARHLCLLAEHAPGVAPPEVTPVYLRAPDAERWIERDHGEPRL